jgi:hypothetical protein
MRYYKTLAWRNIKNTGFHFHTALSKRCWQPLKLYSKQIEPPAACNMNIQYSTVCGKGNMMACMASFGMYKRIKESLSKVETCVLLYSVEGRVKGEFFWIFIFLCIRYSTLLHLPPFRFYCVGGCWDRTQGVATQRFYSFTSTLLRNSFQQKSLSCIIIIARCMCIVQY